MWPVTNTPALATALFGMMAALAALLIRLEVLVEMMSIGESGTTRWMTSHASGWVVGGGRGREEQYGAEDKDRSSVVSEPMAEQNRNDIRDSKWDPIPTRDQ